MKKKQSNKPDMEEEVESSSAEESMETDSDEDNCKDETDSDEDNCKVETKKSSPNSFQLTLIKNQDESSKKKLLKDYFCNRIDCLRDINKLILSKSIEKIPPKYTPWWESFEFSKVAKLKSCKRSSEQPFPNLRLFDNWFDSATGDDSHTWLAGPRLKPSRSEDISQVEDIEVPSVYGNLSKPKTKKALKKERRQERNKTTGKKWFDMKKPDLDRKTKMDMEMIQMRSALNPKQFFKQRDSKGLPKFFQLGSVMDEHSDFYSSRLTKKQRKQTLVEELMSDPKIKEYSQKKYAEITQNSKSRLKKMAKKAAKKNKTSE